MTTTSTPVRAEASLIKFALYFLRLGCFGFGGPIALVGYMQKDLVEERQWIAQQDYLDGLAFSQLAPGPLAAQLAMYLGYVRAGFLGATVVGAGRGEVSLRGVLAAAQATLPEICGRAFVVDRSTGSIILEWAP